MHSLFYWLYAHDRLRQVVELEMPARRSELAQLSASRFFERTELLAQIASKLAPTKSHARQLPVMGNSRLGGMF